MLAENDVRRHKYRRLGPEECKNTNQTRIDINIMLCQMQVAVSNKTLQADASEGEKLFQPLVTDVLFLSGHTAQHHVEHKVRIWKWS